MRTDLPPTIRDVADESGYSVATVSKVINGLPTGQKSRERVEAAIEKLGYQVNTYARALKSSRTNHVVIVMPSLKIPFFAHLTDELIEALTVRGYTYLIRITNYDQEAEQKSFSMVHANKADGIIALSYNPDLVIDESVPIVTIDRRLSPRVPCVSSDNLRGGEMAAEKLIELGCRRLLFMRISSNVPGEPDKRRIGFESVCSRLGVEYKSLILHTDETEAPFFRFLLEHVCIDAPEFDGIFCNSDGLACRTLNFLREHGTAVPEKVQIIGYDGIVDHYSNRYVCSTIAQPIRQMAESAVKLLLNIKDHASCENVCLPVTYVPAGTTKK